jgi:hypothetical protein
VSPKSADSFWDNDMRKDRALKREALQGSPAANKKRWPQGRRFFCSALIASDFF